MIRVLIIADIRLYREGLAQVLGRDGRIRVVGTRAAAEEIAYGASEETPEVVLLDMANASARSGIPIAAQGFPGAKIVALGVANQEDDVIACAEAGVDGYVFREASLEELVATVQSAAAGELRCSPVMAATLLRRVARLAAVREPDPDDLCITRREREVVDLIDKGMSNKEIAARLFIEVATVKNHIHHLLEKLGVHRRGEAAAKMRRVGFARRTLGHEPARLTD